MGNLLPCYFAHAKGKTYLDKYPKAVIEIGELKNKIFVELGGRGK